MDGIGYLIVILTYFVGPYLLAGLIWIRVLGSGSTDSVMVLLATNGVMGPLMANELRSILGNSILASGWLRVIAPILLLARFLALWGIFSFPKRFPGVIWTTETNDPGLFWFFGALAFMACLAAWVATTGPDTTRRRLCFVFTAWFLSLVVLPHLALNAEFRRGCPASNLTCHDVLGGLTLLVHIIVSFAVLSAIVLVRFGLHRILGINLRMTTVFLMQHVVISAPYGLSVLAPTQKVT